MTLVLPTAAVTVSDTLMFEQNKRLLTEPSPVRLDPSRLCLLLALLEGSGLDNLTIAVSHGLAAVEHLDAGSSLCIAVKVLAWGVGGCQYGNGRGDVRN